MHHSIFIDISPNTFALLVVAGMSATGLSMGLILDKLLSRLAVVAGRR